MFSSSVVNEARAFYIANGCGRTVCPVCLGGGSHEDSLSVFLTDQGALKAKCHRASCPTEGYTHRVAEGVAPRNWTVKKAPPHYNSLHNSCPLGPNEAKRFIESYAFELSPHRLASVVRLRRRPPADDCNQAWVFPIYGPGGDEVGVVVRPWQPRTRKSLTFTHGDTESTLMSWYRSSYQDLLEREVYVVEDPVSAICLWSLGKTAVSLNGTGLSRARLDELTEYYHKVVLMLDADATRQAVKYALMYGPDVIRTVRLVNDIKDMSKEEVEELLDDI